VLSGIADELEEHDYHYLIAQHHHRPEVLQKYGEILVSRGVGGFVVIDTHLEYSLKVPVVAVAGHDALPDVTNVLLDHDRAALNTMEHLRSLGHRKVAVIRGQPASSDSAIRWKATAKAAKKMGIEIPKGLVVQLTEDVPSPEHGYTVTRQLLKESSGFTALVCFNDFAALGAIRALEQAKFSVPEDVSVVGFDDIRLSLYARPSITTVRQPLSQMGRTAARLLLKRMQGDSLPQQEYSVEPELIVRESTARPSRSSAKRAVRD
jgi:DNA-binding LacI/PurR family transcriptional regulator